MKKQGTPAKKQGKSTAFGKLIIDSMKELQKTRTSRKRIEAIWSMYGTETLLQWLDQGFFVDLIIHPNTPANIRKEALDQMAKEISYYILSESITSNDPLWDTREENMVRVLSKKEIGRKYVDKIIKLFEPSFGNNPPYFSWGFLSAIALNPITTTAQLESIYKILIKEFYPESFNVFYFLAKNGKLTRKMRENLLTLPLGIFDIIKDQIKTSLIRNPKITKEELKKLADDDSVSVAVIARHELQKRYH